MRPRALTFAGELRNLRERHGISQRTLGKLLAKHGGEERTGEAIRQWEAGLTQPDAPNAEALERIFDLPDGTFLKMLGFQPDDLPERVERLEAAQEMLLATLKKQSSELRRLARQLDGTR